MEGTATLTVDGRSLRDSAIEHGKVVPSEVIYGRVFVSMYPVQCTEGSTRMYTRTRQQCILLLQQLVKSTIASLRLCAEETDSASDSARVSGQLWRDGEGHIDLRRQKAHASSAAVAELTLPERLPS